MCTRRVCYALCMDKKGPQTEVDAWKGVVDRVRLPWRITIEVVPSVTLADRAVVLLRWPTPTDDGETPRWHSGTKVLPPYEIITAASDERFIRRMVQRFVADVVDAEMRFDA